MSVSEIMTIVILFHLSHYRTFKDFYNECLLMNMRKYFPKFVSYSRFVELQAIVETVIDQLKSICQIEHTRHRSPFNFMSNLLAALAAYVLRPRKPSLKFDLNANTTLSLMSN